MSQKQYIVVNPSASFVGPAGPQGPVGPRGPEGPGATAEQVRTEVEAALDARGIEAEMERMSGQIAQLEEGAVRTKYAQPDWGTERANVVYMPETTFELTDMGEGLMMGVLAAALPYEFVVGNIYEVTYNGVEYSCECYFGDNGRGSGSGTYVLGNAQVMGFEGAPESDAPFMFGCLKGEDMMESMGGIYGMIIPLDGAASVTLSIAGEATLMHEIPAAYVEPAPVPPLIVTVSLVDGTTTVQSSHSAAEIIRAIESGRMVYVRNGRFMYGFSYFDEDETGAADVFFTGVTFEGGSSFIMATVQISDTSTGTQVRFAAQNMGGS